MRSEKRKSSAEDQPDERGKTSPVYLVSGASGASGEHLIETVLAQFPGIHVPVIKMTHVRQKAQVKDIIRKASKTEGTIVHTLVNAGLRRALISLGEQHGVMTIDLMGGLLDRLEHVSGCPPKGKPGLYRKLHKEYFDRIAAIEFTMAHDDGQRPHDLPSADIVLTGVSRCGKTPLSMYLAVHGWKVANVPLVLEVPPPEELSKINRRRVIGLSIAYEHLMVHRRERQAGMGIPGPSKYTDRATVLQELEAARRFFKKGGFHVVSVTDKPIESIAEEIIEYMNMNLQCKPGKSR
ncbi:MAG: kinase/pyrophosphorylase [Nitrospirae bacterium]|nr:kinase/pyrophosphorylase [Nitrospirota bacterium]